MEASEPAKEAGPVDLPDPTVPGTVVLAAMLCLFIGLLPLGSGTWWAFINGVICIFLAGILLMGFRAVWCFAVGWMGVLLLGCVGLMIRIGMTYDPINSILMLIPMLMCVGELLLLWHPDSREYCRK